MGSAAGRCSDAAERLGEVAVGGRVRARQVERRRAVVVEQEPDGPHLVGQGDPAEPLAPVTGGAPEAELGRQQRLAQDAAVGTEHDAGADVGHPHAGRLGRPGRVLPRSADGRQRKPARTEALASERVLVAAVPVSWPTAGDPLTSTREAMVERRPVSARRQGGAPGTRRCRGCVARWASVQRPDAMPSPARCTTASAAARPTRSMVPRAGSQAIDDAGCGAAASPDGRPGRVTASTSWPSVFEGPGGEPGRSAFQYGLR